MDAINYQQNKIQKLYIVTTGEDQYLQYKQSINMMDLLNKTKFQEFILTFKQPFDSQFTVDDP